MGLNFAWWTLREGIYHAMAARSVRGIFFAHATAAKDVKVK
jgi:hypothetical protein